MDRLEHLEEQFEITRLHVDQIVDLTANVENHEHYGPCSRCEAIFERTWQQLGCDKLLEQIRKAEGVR